MMTNRAVSEYDQVSGTDSNSLACSSKLPVAPNHCGLAFENPFGSKCSPSGIPKSGNWKWLFRSLAVLSVLYLFVAVALIRKMEYPEQLLQSVLAYSLNKTTANIQRPPVVETHELVEPPDWEIQHKQIVGLKHQVQELTQRLVQVQQVPLHSNAGTEPVRPAGEKEPFTVPRVLATLPASSGWCHGERKNRVCTFKNLYFDAETLEWIFVKTNDSVLAGMEDVDLNNVLDMTTLEDHNAFYFRLTEVADTRYAATTVQKATKLTFILSRFHTGNIMHSIHDDLLGLYQLCKQYARAERGTHSEASRFNSFSKDNFILFCDGHDEGGYGHVFKYLTDNPLQFMQQIKDSKQMFWFPDCVVGNSKMLNWYQYGFLTPQGPIAGKTVNGFYVREVSDYISFQLNYPAWDMDEWQKFLHTFVQHALRPAKTAGGPLLSETYNIAIFSRTHDRLIVNENDLVTALREKFRLPVLFVRNEDMSFPEQVKLLRNTVVAIGMHGSLLVMGMFMRPGSLMVEMYPYAVPCENYTPYKTMCGLQGMNISYRAWSNKHAENNASFPDRIPHYGGIQHLPEAEQRQIINTLTVPPHLCCSNPYWLYRIFQDTKVDYNELEAAIIDGLKESPMQLEAFMTHKPTILPGIVVNPTCTFDKEKRTINLKWDPPRNLAAGERNVYYLVWSHEHYKEFTATTNSISITDCNPEKPHDIWIKPAVRGNSQFSGSYSEKVTCS